MNKKVIFEIECSQCIENVTGDLKASNLFFDMIDTVGIRTTTFDLTYKPWWNSIDNELELTEIWVCIYQQRVVWNSDITYYFPSDWSTYRLVLARYYAYGLGKILDGICELNGFTYTSILHVGYIVMSHVGSDKSKRLHVHYNFK